MSYYLIPFVALGGFVLGSIYQSRRSRKRIDILRRSYEEQIEKLKAIHR